MERSPVCRMADDLVERFYKFSHFSVWNKEPILHLRRDIVLVAYYTARRTDLAERTFRKHSCTAEVCIGICYNSILCCMSPDRVSFKRCTSSWIAIIWTILWVLISIAAQVLIWTIKCEINQTNPIILETYGKHPSTSLQMLTQWRWKAADKYYLFWWIFTLRFLCTSEVNCCSARFLSRNFILITVFLCFLFWIKKKK